jgi:hypothetical protein
MSVATMVAPAVKRRGHRHMPQHRVITDRVGFSIPRLVLTQSDAVFEARNEYRSELILRVVRAFTAGTWSPDITRKLPAEGKPGKVQLRLRPQDLDPYKAKCEREQLPFSTPVAHGLWLYATTPDPRDLPF